MSVLENYTMSNALEVLSVWDQGVIDDIESQEPLFLSKRHCLS